MNHVYRLTRRSCLATAVFFGILWLPLSTAAQVPALSQDPTPLFASRRDVPPSSRAHHVTPKRSRIVTARLASLVADRGRPNQRILLNLFDDVEVIARRRALDVLGSDAFVWHGNVEDPDGPGAPGDATLVVRGDIVIGTVFFRGRTFEIGYTGGGEHEITELDPSAFPTDDPPVDPSFDTPAQGSISSTPGLVTAADASTQIDVLVVWTPAARAAAGGPAAMQSLVDLAIANTNAAYANSLINTRVRLVYSGEVNYVETPSNIGMDLQRLQTAGDGYLDNVQALRDSSGADQVSLIGNGYTGACGIANQMTVVTPYFAPNAFSVVERSCAAGNLTLAHEMGHNQGMQHDPANAGSAAYPYSYGYQDPSGAFRTVMAYGASTRVKQFSNPGVAYGGLPTGTSTQDNARTLNSTALTVANFRQAISNGCTFALSPSTASFPSSGGSASVSIATSAGCSWTVTNATGWVTTSATSGSGPATITVTAGSSTAAARNATLTIAGQSFDVIQASGCTFSVAPSSASFGAGGGAVDVVVSTAATCGWSVTNTTAWVTTTASSGTGPKTVTLTAGINSGAPRSGSLTIAGRAVSVSQAGGCTYTVSPTSANFPSGGGQVNVSLSTTATCGWSVTNPTGWVSTSATSGTGPATVTLTAGTNSGAIRTGSVTIAGQPVSLSQASGCAYGVSPSSVSLSPSGGSVSVAVSTTSTCGWAVANTAGWVSTSALSGTGPATVTITAAPNSAAARITTLVIGGQTVTVSQASGCVYAVSPTQLSFPKPGGALLLSVTTTPGCAWSVSSALNWLAVSPASGTASGNVTVTASNNSGGPSRAGTVVVAGATVTVAQAGSKVSSKSGQQR